ncbi:MAG TPA: response regulator [Opitutaceae bacterium]|nr:response regulator [Opitutaceae bacterium]
MSFEGKILLVDDEAHVRKFISLVVRQLGSPQIIEASNGAEAVEIYKQESPELVLLDVNMPVQDGLETLKQIVQHDPNAVVVMLTSLANRQTVQEAVQNGAVNYLRKDTPKDEILQALRRTIADCFPSNT